MTVVAVIVSSACGVGGPDGDATDGQPAGTSTSAAAPLELTDAEVVAVGMERAVAVSGSSCGDAGASVGSGVIVGPDRVLTAAHVVAGLADLEVSIRSDHPAQAVERVPGSGSAADAGSRSDTSPVAVAPATIVAFDPLRDLALLEADLSQWPDPETELSYRVLGAGDTGVMVGGMTSGDVTFAVAKKVIIETDEIRGDGRSQRSGYRIEAETTSGDSGAGLYGRAGDFAGMLFAVSTEDGGRSWATAADEIELFLSDGTVAGDYVCNPDRSIVEARS